MRKYTLFLALLTSICVAGQVQAADLVVPNDYITIQEAVDAAGAGDSILINRGVYQENVSVVGHVNLTIKNAKTAASAVKNVVIDGNGIGPVFDIKDSSVTISGLTIQNGFNSLYGAGVTCLDNSDVKITNNVLKQHVGTVISVRNATAEIQDNVITENHNTNYSSAAIKAGGSTPTYVSINNNQIKNNNFGEAAININRGDADIVNNIIMGNVRGGSGQIGSGISVYNLSHVKIKNNLIVENPGGNGVNLIMPSGSTAEIINNTISYNGEGGYDGITLMTMNSDQAVIRNNIITNNARYGINVTHYHAQAAVTYNNLYANGEANYGGVMIDLTGVDGNIAVKPIYVNAQASDYHLLSKKGKSSACIDAGDPNDDYLKEPEPNGMRINQGAYGNTREAARSR